MSNSLGIYIHVPFCLRKCFYCDFYSVADLGLMEEYVKALRRQILETAKGLPGFIVDTVFFGGGTPSLLSDNQVFEILEAVAAIGLNGNAEISLEVNPASTDQETLRGYRKAGINRLSIGMQSALEQELFLLGRLHTNKDTLICVEQVQKSGFTNYNLDLMYGLPGQTAENWRFTLESALNLEPEHLSLYALTLSESVQLYRRKEEIPSDEEQREVYLDFCKVLSARGFLHYEISNFAKPGKECRHNLGYWKRLPYLGFGPAASSFFKHRRFDAPMALKGFLENQAPLLEQIRSEPVIAENESLAEALMLSLRLSEGLLLEPFCSCLGARKEAFFKQMKWFVEASLAKLSQDRFYLLPEGFFVSNEITARLLLAAGL